MSHRTSPDIRIITPEQYVDLGIAAYAFGKSPAKPDPERKQARLAHFANTIPLAVYEDNEALASCSVSPMTENLRGALLPMGAVGAVASLPQGRRRGHVRAMLRHSYEVMHERNMPISALYPFRESFYERLGYATMPHNRFTRVKPETLAPLLREDLPGDVTQVDIATGFDAWWAFLEEFQAGRHGMALQERDRATEMRDRNDRWVALVREEGAVTGAMTFQVTGYTEALRADTFYTTTPAARYQLLAWIARHVDQVADAIIELAPDEFPELWFRDIAPTTSTADDHAWPAPMARVISVAGLAGIGAGDGAGVSIRITDDLCPWNTGTWTLGSEGGSLTVESGGTPACEISIHGLAALAWTGVDPATFRYRGWGDPDHSVQQVLRALFPPALPLLHEKF